MENLFQIIDALGKEAKRTQELALKFNNKATKGGFLERFENKSSGDGDIAKMKKIEGDIKKLEEENKTLVEERELIKSHVRILKRSLGQIN